MVDNHDHFVQFDVTVDANCESNEPCISELRSSSINQTINVSTTTSTNSPELEMQLELTERLKLILSGDGLIERKSNGVCC